MLCVLKLAVGYLIELYIILYIIYNLNQSYLFDFQRDKIFNCGKKIFLIVLSVYSVYFVDKKYTKYTEYTAKSVVFYALI